MTTIDKIVIVSGKNTGKEYPIRKRMVIGADPKSDIVIASGEKKVFSIERIGETCVLKNLTDKGLVVSEEEEVFEKILVSGDRIRLDRTEFEFREDTGEISIDFARKNKNLLTFATIILVLLFIVVIFYYRRPNEIKTEAEKKTEQTREKVIAAKNSLSKAEVAAVVKEANYEFKIAEHYYQESRLDSGNLYRAIFSWKKVLKSLENITPRPPLYQRAKERLSKTEGQFNQRIKYLRNNAFVAYKSGQTDYLKDILKMIMHFVPEPTDKNYIWAKRKLMAE